ncbi:MAG: methyltransferase domain-containing protein [Chloroflexi bacterium]|nr:methyltransferase domain-containing protein [Chloroflexota bacterium]
MLSVVEQVKGGKLACPISRQPLHFKGDELETTDGRYRYPLINGVPVLLPVEQQETYLAQEQGSMEKEYAATEKQSAARKQSSVKRWFNQWVSRDYRSQPSRDAFEQTIEDQPDDALCVAVGGGPHHVHPKLVNLNIGLFPNVHVVGDAYALPYADNSVDAIHCEAVLEHLEFPNEAAAEMFRVLRPGGQAFAATPFMQHFHAYPNHFQNFTLIGHRRLFERAGFEVVSAGVCVGPTYAVWGLLFRYLYTYIRISGLKQLVSGAAALWALLMRPLDKRLNRSPKAHLLASTTYAHLTKDAFTNKI